MDLTVQYILLVFLFFYQGFCEARSLVYDDLKTEIIDLRAQVADLEQRTARQASHLSELTQLVLSQDTPSAGETELQVQSRQKRGIRWHRQRAEIGFLVALARHQLAVEKDDVLLFDHVITNIGNAFDSKTGTFVCKIPGTYMFDLSLVVDVGSYIEASIKLNGVSEVTAISDHRVSTSGWNQGSAVAILILRRGDVVSVNIDWPFEPQTLRGEGKTTFSGYLLRRHFNTLHVLARK